MPIVLRRMYQKTYRKGKMEAWSQSCEDTKVIQVTENGCLGEGGSSGVSEKHLSSIHLKVINRICPIC